MSTIAVPEEIQDQLNEFASVVWGNPQAVLRRADPSGFEYIDLTKYFDGLQWVFNVPIEHKIFVRDEYHIALQALQTKTYSKGAYVTGQTGIGKTFFLIFLLVELLGQKSMVALQFMNGCTSVYAIFGNKVTCHLLEDSKSLHDSAVTWALADSNCAVRSPDSLFYCSWENDIRTIQTTEPERARWKGWSKQSGAQCYIMDIWTVEEIADLAKLLGLDVGRMTTLARRWGGIPRNLLQYCEGDCDSHFENMHKDSLLSAIWGCRDALSALMNIDLNDDPPADFYFYRPRESAKRGMARRRPRACVPTPTLCHMLGKGLGNHDDATIRNFFRAMSTYEETRQTAKDIYANWFHSYFSAAMSIDCHWVQGSSDTSKLQGMAVISPLNWQTLLTAKPPYYWVAPKDFPGIHGALVLDQEIYVIQVVMDQKLNVPNEGMKELRNRLPAELKNVPWRVVFVGPMETYTKVAAREWGGKIYFPTNETCVPVAWSTVDPIHPLVSYKVYNDESDPDAQLDEREANHESMDVDNTVS